jgi:hypothetical protein
MESEAEAEGALMNIVTLTREYIIMIVHVSFLALVSNIIMPQRLYIVFLRATTTTT